MKKLQMILMVIFLCFTITGIYSLNKSEYVEAATNSTVKLSSSSIKLAKGDSTQIKLNGASGTIIWKSSKTSVAKVSSKGKVSAVKEGTATITATYNNKTYKCKVTVTKRTLYSTAYSLTIFQPTTIVISTDLYDKNETIYASTDDASIVDFSWGDWIDDNNALLTLKPQKKGSTNIRITSNKSDQERVIPVKNVSSTNYNDKGALTAKQIYAKCKSATAQITTDLGVGSGFYIAKGKLITNYHVIKGSTNISIMNTDGNTYEVKNILGYDETLDIAILSVSCTDNASLILNTHGLTTGEDVYAFGNPLGLTDTFTAGVIENICRYVDLEPYIQSSAPISSGNSGGALVNAFGEVVGINSAYFTDGQNLNLAIPVHQIYSVSTYKPISLNDFVQNKSDQSKEVVEEYTEEEKLAAYGIRMLNELLRKPKSLVIDEISYIVNQYGDSVIFINYSAENGYGGTNRKNITLTLDTKIDNWMSYSLETYIGYIGCFRNSSPRQDESRVIMSIDRVNECMLEKCNEQFTYYKPTSEYNLFHDEDALGNEMIDY